MPISSTALKPLMAATGSPCLSFPNTRTEQDARVSRLFTLTACAKRAGEDLITIRVRDLEALIAIAATSDAGVSR